MKIGVLTSGGDCSGLNSAIRAIVLGAPAIGAEIIGIKRGSAGLMERPYDIISLTPETINSQNLLELAGTILGATNKDDPFHYPGPNGKRGDYSHLFSEAYHDLGLNALIGIGGDGSLAIIRRMAQKGNMNFVGIPKTIDNDVYGTEFAIGFDTALGVATEAIDRLKTTAASHQRIMVLEVMGRDAGHIALRAGIAGGADIILVPEIPYSLEAIESKIKELRQRGQNHVIMVVSESVKNPEGAHSRIEYAHKRIRYNGISYAFAEAISERTGQEARAQILGHMQRGGITSSSDRLLATRFGIKALELVKAGKFDHMVALQSDRIVDLPLSDIVHVESLIKPEDEVVSVAKALGIYVGEV